MDTVRVWMSAPAIVARDTQTLPEGRRILQDSQIRRLPVVNAAGELVGIVTEGDISRISDSPERDMSEYNLYYRVRDLPLREFMRRPVITVTPDTSVYEAAYLMRSWRIHGMPVVVRSQVIGMLTVSDLLRRIVDEQSNPEFAPLDERSAGLD